MNASTDVVRRVYDDEGCFLEVGPDSDGLGNVRVATTMPSSVEWFGKIDFGCHPAFMRELGKALIAAADEIEKETK